jgi:hypothetical protein
MRRLARQDSNKEAISWFLSQVGNPDSLDDCLRSVWQYVKDPPGVEYIASPDLQIVRALQQHRETGRFVLWGDCDEAATLAASLLFYCGVPCCLVAIRMAGDIEFSHVFVRTARGDIDPTVAAAMLPLWNYEEALEVCV